MSDVIITPASGLIDFQNTSGISSATIQLDVSGNLNISNPGGDLTIGDGINNTDQRVGIGSTIPTSKLTVTGDVSVSGVITCTDINSTSDINLKENIQTVDNALNIVNDLRGVKFEWKENHKPSFGVVAQELQKVLPELVTNTDPKTVNYNGIIGVLIEAIKEQQRQIEELRARIDEINI
jgi:hypothetical protein